MLRKAAQIQKSSELTTELIFKMVVIGRALMFAQILVISIQIIAISQILGPNQRFVHCAQLNSQQQQGTSDGLAGSLCQSVPISPLADTAHTSDKVADLLPLINETLAINNKSVSVSDSFIKDDWTFEMVEYDLMDFLQDLNARYKLSNRSEPTEEQAAAINSSNWSSQLEAKSEQQQQKTTAQRCSTTTNLPFVQAQIEKVSAQAPVEAKIQQASTSSNQNITHPTKIPELSTSLASGDDHDIAESTWQYGIFDRFTRARPSSTSTTTRIPYSSDSFDKLDSADFNSHECGLRVYEDQTQNSPPLESVISTVRRQRPSLLGSMSIKPFQPTASDRDDKDSSGDKSVADWLNQNERDAYESYNKSPTETAVNGGGNAGDDSYDPLSSDGGSFGGEFNLSSRRHWMQQQLGTTLQMLGFNSSNQLAGDFVNQTASLSLNNRENMMKKQSKSVPDFGSYDQNNKLSARQDELKLEARVIGGTDARLGDSPWSVSLQALVSKPGGGGVEYRHYCGGTIISERYILTAAHCLDFMVGRESRLFVVIGDLNWRMNAASLHGRRIAIEKLIIHGGYKSTAFGHDIGLIRTKEIIKPVKVNGKYIINSVCLPPKNYEHTGEAELVGWGLFSNRNEMADSLQIADVPILPRPLCVDLYRRRTGLIQWLIGIELITEKQVCAGTFGRGICQGDSGSALVYNDRISKRENRQLNKLMRNGPVNRNHQTRATIIGIVAFGGIRRCSYQSLPGVYMQTSKYLDWILPRIQHN